MWLFSKLPTKRNWKKRISQKTIAVEVFLVSAHEERANATWNTGNNQELFEQNGAGGNEFFCFTASCVWWCSWKIVGKGVEEESRSCEFKPHTMHTDTWVLDNSLLRWRHSPWRATSIWEMKKEVLGHWRIEELSSRCLNRTLRKLKTKNYDVKKIF